MNITWSHPEVLARARAALAAGTTSWQDLFSPGDGAADEIRVGARPADVGVPDAVWPPLAAHLARAERVREVVARAGLAAAAERFADSPHAVERAALVDEAAAATGEDGQPAGYAVDLQAILGVLACAIDPLLAYGPFLSLLVGVGVRVDADATVAAYERFVADAARVPALEPTWIERQRLARSGLADLYVRVGRLTDAERVFQERFDEEPGDTAVAIGAARAYLEIGETARTIAWLERAATRARAAGRTALADQLEAKVGRLRARLKPDG